MSTQREMKAHFEWKKMQLFSLLFNFF